MMRHGRKLLGCDREDTAIVGDRMTRTSSPVSIRISIPCLCSAGSPARKTSSTLPITAIRSFRGGRYSGMIWNNRCRVVIFDFIVKNQDTTPSTFEKGGPDDDQENCRYAFGKVLVVGVFWIVLSEWP